MLLMGRKKTSDRHKTKMFGLRLSEPYRRLLEQIAKQNRRTLTEEMKVALEAHAEKHGLSIPTKEASS